MADDSPSQSWFQRLKSRIRRGPLWRLRNRLLLTYFLIGVVPLVLILGMLGIAAKIFYGQFAADRVRAAMLSRVDQVHTAAQDIALAARFGNPEPFVAAQQQRISGLRVVLRNRDRVLALPGTAELTAIPEWLAADDRGVIQSGDKFFAAAHITAPEGDVFAYLPLNEQTLGQLMPGLAIVVMVPSDARIRVDLNRGAFLKGKNGEWVPAESTQSLPLPAASSTRDSKVGWMMPWKVRTPDGKEGAAYVMISSHSSLLFDEFFSSLGPFATIWVWLVMAIGAVLLLIELFSLVWSIGLTRTITRSVHDLYEGTRQVAGGNLDHRTPVHGKHQLSELAGSFNSMTERVQRLIVEVRKKEKLEAELEIARQVQLRLFPKSVPKLKTMELAARCIPSRFVSGDYYDFVPPDGRYMALALADISGKGIAAALLMASVQSALHAQLKFAGGVRAAGGNLSTADLMTQMSQQLYESTPAEKYATFFLSLYDDETGRLHYTNAGHCPPILVRDGKAAPLAGNGLVVGLLPRATYEEESIQLEPGDLLAVFSDGVPEAENAAQDQFGEERLSELLIHNAAKPLEEIINLITDQVMAWAHDKEAQDDTTILLARVRGN